MKLTKLLAKLDQTERQSIRPVPAKWWTFEQFMADTGLSRNAAQRKILKLQEHRLIKRKAWQGLRRRRIWIYTET